MQRKWPSGHARWKQGLHSTRSHSTRAAADRGGVCSGLDEPNSATCGRPSAAATCMRPESFVTTNRETIQALVRWVLESPTMRESLRGELLALHAMFTTDLRQAITELCGDPVEAELLTTTLSSLLAGNLLFGVIDPGAAQDDVRRGGLRILAERMIFSAAARARDRAARA